MNGNFIPRWFVSFGNLDPGWFSIRRRRQVDIKHTLARVAIKMAMFLHIGTIASGRPIQVDFTDQAAIHKGIQTVVNGGEGDICHPLFGPGINFFDRRMITLLEKHMINVVALTR